MPFHVGQIIELFDTLGFEPNALLKQGDRGTVIRSEMLNVNDWSYSVILWHKDHRESTMVDGRLRVYVNPMDRPGRDSGSHATWQALSTVIQREESYAMQEMKRDVERAHVGRAPPDRLRL